LEAVYYLHQRQIVHGDIKLSNIMITRNLKVKLMDFQFSTMCSHSRQLISTYCGTFPYFPPEILDKTPYNGKPYQDSRPMSGVWELFFLK
jgi:serine/threonine protein kinase